MQEVRHKEYNRAALRDVVQKTQGSLNVGATPARLECEQFTNDAQQMAAPLLRLDEKFDFVAEKQESDFVAIAQCGHSKRRRHLRGKLALGDTARAEIARSRYVDHQER